MWVNELVSELGAPILKMVIGDWSCWQWTEAISLQLMMKRSTLVPRNWWSSSKLLRPQWTWSWMKWETKNWFEYNTIRQELESNWKGRCAGVDPHVWLHECQSSSKFGSGTEICSRRGIWICLTFQAKPKMMWMHYHSVRFVTDNKIIHSTF